jgi:hypothetical protein
MHACEQFHNKGLFGTAPLPISQLRSNFVTHPTPKTLLLEKGGVQPQLHVFPGVPQEVLPKFKF